MPHAGAAAAPWVQCSALVLFGSPPAPARLSVTAASPPAPARRSVTVHSQGAFLLGPPSPGQRPAQAWTPPPPEELQSPCPMPGPVTCPPAPRVLKQ